MSDQPSQFAETPMNQIDFTDAVFNNAAISIAEVPFNGYLNLRGAANDDGFCAIVERELGVALPLNNNTCVHYDGAAHGAENEQLSLFWLGPDEWLIVCAQGKQMDLRDKLRHALAATFATVTDTSGGNTMLTISGSAAVDIVRKGCPLDVHPRVFKAGSCVQTVMAKTTVLLYPDDDSASNQRQFCIIVRRSFADYLGVWLRDAAREFG